jgi:pilus assembly protein CpaE
VSVPAVRCVVVASDPAITASCVAAVDGAAGIDVVASVSRSRVLGGAVPACEVLLVADAPGAPAADWADEAARACPHAAIVLLAEQADIETYRSALKAGAGAIAGLPVTSPGLTAAVADAVSARRSNATRTDARPGVVIAVAGARGGVGTSAVALGLAATAGALLVDLAGSRAGLAFALGARPDRSLAELAQAGDALAAGIATVAIEHPSGLRYVAGPPDPDLLGVLAAGWGSALVRELRAREHVSVLDVGCAAFATQREALAAADRMLVVVTPGRAALEAARALVLDAVRWGVAAGPEIVVNRWSRRADVGLRAIARIVDAPVSAVLRDDRRAMSGYDAGRLDLDRWTRTGPPAALAAVAGGLRP